MYTKPLTILVLSLTAVGVLLGIIAPTAVWGRPIEDTICGNLETTQKSIDQRLTAAIAHVAQLKSTSAQKLLDRRAQDDADILRTRITTDQTFAQTMDALAAKARSKKERTAVVDAKKKIEAALTARRTAIDAAMVTARTKTDALVNDRTRTLANAEEALRSAVTDTFSRSKNICTHIVGINTTDTRKELHDTLQAAHQQFTKTLQTTDFQKSLSDIDLEKKQAITAAEDAYQKNIVAVITQLKAAFQ